MANELGWHWTYSNGARSSDFPDQAEAEAWLGETWAELLASGVEEVVLLEGERRVYGPMRLSAD